MECSFLKGNQCNCADIFFLFLSAIVCDMLSSQYLLASLNNTEFSHPNVVQLSCQFGYWLQPSFTTLKCNASGHWKPSPTPCKPIKCPALEVHSSGIITNEGQGVFADVVEYTCKDGFQLVKIENGSKVIESASFTTLCSQPKPRSGTGIGRWIPSPNGFTCVKTSK